MIKTLSILLISSVIICVSGMVMSFYSYDVYSDIYEQEIDSDKLLNSIEKSKNIEVLKKVASESIEYTKFHIVSHSKSHKRAGYTFATLTAILLCALYLLYLQKISNK